MTAKRQRAGPGAGPRNTDPVPFVFFNEIGILDQLSRSAFERVMPGALTLPQFSVLNHLVRLGDGKTPGDLARAFQVTKGAMTNTLGRLEDAGLIRIAPDAEDGRSKRVLLTPAGRRMRARAIAALDPFFARLVKDFPMREFEAALPFLKRLRAYLDRARDGKET